MKRQRAVAHAAFPMADTQRAVIHFDLDAFYAQVEERRNPSLRAKPLGVTQKFLVITCNYAARKYGVTKCMRIEEAQRLCPSLKLVSASDTTPYRQASDEIAAVLRNQGSAFEKLGWDEMVIDVTAQAMAMVGEMAERELREQSHAHIVGNTACGEGVLLLLAADQIAENARRAVLQQCGLRCSAGIAHNKFLAKLAAGVHKPDAQTIMPASAAAKYLAERAVKVLPGVGWQLQQRLNEVGIATVQQLREVHTHSNTAYSIHTVTQHTAHSIHTVAQHTAYTQ
jgi:DNA polymerase iota